MKVISCKEAKAQGLKFYFTGKPCKRGHLSERYVSYGGCVECEHIRNTSERKKQTDRQWRANNRERKKQIDRQWKKDNPDKCNAYTANRRAQKKKAIPKWATDEDRIWINGLFSLAKAITEVTGIPHEVDHIYPLTSDVGCGLHCPQNMQILPVSENRSKNNTWCYDDVEPKFNWS